LKFPILTFFLFLLIFSSCINDQPVTDAKPVAKVYNNYLYESELLGLVPFGASQEDSMAIISSYINNWIKKQLLLTQAEENLTKQQKDFSKQLEEYRNSLILYTYESELVRQNLDTVVNMWEMERYYNENTENFVLGEDIVKFLYIKIKDDAPALKQIVKLFKTNFVRNLDSLVYYAINFSEDYSLVTEDWVPFNRFLSKMPFNVDNSKYFLENNRFVEVKEDSFLQESVDTLAEKLYNKVYQSYKLKMKAIAEKAAPVIKDVFENHTNFENIAIPISDGIKTRNIIVNLKKAYENGAREINLAIEKSVTLGMIDEAWKEHLREMDDLKQSVQAATYEQKDPLLIYKFESFQLFKRMVQRINREITSFLIKGDLPIQSSGDVREAQLPRRTDRRRMSESRDDLLSQAHSNTQQRQKPEPVKVEKKVGRNEPCPCGSGKKYKHCHGRAGG
jgi:hypothetical protein